MSVKVVKAAAVVCALAAARRATRQRGSNCSKGAGNQARGVLGPKGRQACLL